LHRRFGLVVRIVDGLPVTVLHRAWVELP
jgi:hypothetical protein